MYVDNTIEKTMQDGDEGYSLMSRKNCTDLYDLYGSLSFYIGKTEFKIHPKGYLFQLPGQVKCFIGVQAIDDDINEYRLG